MHRRGDYTLVSDRFEEKMEAHWKNFYVDLAGNTQAAHKSYVDKLKRAGHTEVSSLEDCDYCVIFCPTASRVGTDVGEALERDAATVGKPVILVVMHHTFNRDHVVADSRRLVDKANVRLTVDCLFHDGKLLDSNTNDIAWHNIQRTLGLPRGWLVDFGVMQILKRKMLLILGAVITVSVIVTVIVLAVKLTGNQKESGHHNN